LPNKRRYRVKYERALELRKQAAQQHQSTTATPQQRTTPSSSNSYQSLYSPVTSDHGTAPSHSTPLGLPPTTPYSPQPPFTFPHSAMLYHPSHGLSGQFVPPNATISSYAFGTNMSASSPPTQYQSVSDQQYGWTPEPQRHIRFDQLSYQQMPANNTPYHGYPPSVNIAPPPTTNTQFHSQQQQLALPPSQVTDQSAGVIPMPNGPPPTMQHHSSYGHAASTPDYSLNDNNSAKKTRFFVQRVRAIHSGRLARICRQCR
jgi:translation initiation factor 4G